MYDGEYSAWLAVKVFFMSSHVVKMFVHFFSTTSHAFLGVQASTSLAKNPCHVLSSWGTNHNIGRAMHDTSTLLVPTTRRSTLGDLVFPAAAARAWNSLPCHVRDMPSLLAFRRELKTLLFSLSYPVD